MCDSLRPGLSFPFSSSSPFNVHYCAVCLDSVLNQRIWSYVSVIIECRQTQARGDQVGPVVWQTPPLRGESMISGFRKFTLLAVFFYVIYLFLRHLSRLPRGPRPTQMKNGCV